MHPGTHGRPSRGVCISHLTNWATHFVEVQFASYQPSHMKPLPVPDPNRQSSCLMPVKWPCCTQMPLAMLSKLAPAPDTRSPQRKFCGLLMSPHSHHYHSPPTGNRCDVDSSSSKPMKQCYIISQMAPSKQLACIYVTHLAACMTQLCGQSHIYHV